MRYTAQQYVPHLWPRRKPVRSSGGFLLALGQPLQLKPFKSFAEQLALLQQRGLAVEDQAAALATLRRLGYYRLAGYFYPLRVFVGQGQPRRDEFVAGASLSLVVSLYEFDKSLRLLVLDAIERIEVAMRVAIAYRLGQLHPEAHLQTQYLDARFFQSRNGDRPKHEVWCEKLGHALNRSSEDFAQHHMARYGSRMPIWVAIELWDFGMLSFFYQGMAYKHREAVAKDIGGLTADQLVSWLRTLNFARNVAAHHSRLWNRSVPEVPKMPSAQAAPLLAHVAASGAQYRLYGALACIRYLLRSIQADAGWHTKLVAHMQQFPQTPLLSLSAAGFPGNWADKALWQ